jgi:hypothetical protein
MYNMYDTGSGIPGLSGGSNFDLLSLLLGRQPSAAQSLASAYPFLKLPGQQTAAYAPAREDLAAMTDTNNPLYQQIHGQQKQQGQQNLAESIRELTGQNRKLASMGRVPLFDPERGGEQLFRGITSGYQDVQNTAAGNTRNILGTAAAGNMQMGALQSQTAANQAGIHGNILGALTKLFGL